MPACTLVWMDPDPRLRHDEHSCVFVTAGPHSRHECACGALLVD